MLYAQMIVIVVLLIGVFWVYQKGKTKAKNDLKIRSLEKGLELKNDNEKRRGVGVDAARKRLRNNAIDR